VAFLPQADAMIANRQSMTIGNLWNVRRFVRFKSAPLFARSPEPLVGSRPGRILATAYFEPDSGL
jgi:hypothetical protein